MFLGVFCYLLFSCLLSLCKTVNSSIFITHVLTSLDNNDALPSAKITVSSDKHFSKENR